MRRVLSWILLIPSYQAVISDPLAPVPLVWSGHPLAKINIAQNKGVASKEGRDLPTMQSARRQLTCVLICFCVHLSFNSLYPLFSAFRIGFKSEIISVIFTFFAASSSSNILSHLFMRYIFHQDLSYRFAPVCEIYLIRGVYAGEEQGMHRDRMQPEMQTVFYFKAKSN